MRKKTIAVILCIMLVIVNLNVGSYANLSKVDAEEMYPKSDATISDAIEVDDDEVDVDETETSFSSAQTVGNVTVSVTADKGVFPEGSTLLVRSVSNSEEEAVSNAVDQSAASNEKVVSAYTFDIKVLDATGTEIEPDNSKGNVKVSFAMSEVANANLATNVWHVEGEVGSLEAEKLQSSENGTTVTADTTGFSYYQVEFTYGEKEYVLPGDTSVKLTDILSCVGITNADGGAATDSSITAATGSDDSLFTVKKENGVWMATAVTAFASHESLNVTVDGVEYEIVVTDDNEGHTHGGITFLPWTNPKSLPDPARDKVDNYYLTTDVTVSSPWYWKFTNYKINLCLNGHKITFAGNTSSYDHNGIIYLCGNSKGGELNLFDETSESGGAIISNVETIDPTVYITMATMNMYGGTITGANTDRNGGAVSVSSGTFNMYGGSISGNAASAGGGVHVSGGTFNMYGGTISGNTASYAGGGVYVGTGTFNMLGGTISDNNSGVYLSTSYTFVPTFNMSGGEITNNKGGYGVSIASALSGVGGACTVSGNVKISGNTDRNDKNRNVYLNNYYDIYNTIKVGNLDESATIGIGAYKPGVFSDGGSDYIDNFISDNPDLKVVVDEDGNLKLSDDVPITGVNLNKDTTTLGFGESETLIANVEPSEATDKTVTWASSDPDVVSVDSDGKITANALGEATITVTATNGTDDTADDKIATCTVTVEEADMAVTANGWSGKYDGAEHGISVEVTKPASGAIIKYGTSAEACNLDQSPTITNVSDSPFTVYYKITAPNYKDIEDRFETVTISKDDSSVSTEPTAKTGLTYTGEEQDLINAGTTNDGEMQYSLDGATYSPTIPKGKDVKEYTVYYKIVGDSNHNDSSYSTPVKVSIDPVDKTALKDLITAVTDYYNNISNDYSSVSAELKDAIDKAQLVHDNDNQTAGQVSDAIDELNDALNKAKAEVVMDIISKLPTPDNVTTEHKTVIETARQAFEDLTDAQKSKVSNESKTRLEDDEAALLSKTKEAAKKELKTKYDNLVESGDYDDDGLDELKNAYDEAVAAIDASTVPDTKNAPKDSGAWESEIAGEEALDAVKTAAKKLTEMIDALPDPNDVKPENKDDIENARKIYDTLTDHQKEQVDDDTKKKLIDDEIALVEKVISALPDPDDVTVDDKEPIEEAIKLYDSLTPEQQEKIADDIRKKLVDDETALLDRTKEAAKEKLKEKYNRLVESGNYDDEGLVELEEAYKEAFDSIDETTIIDTMDEPKENGPWYEEKVGEEALDAVKTVAKKASEIIEALPSPDDVTLGHKDAIEKAREAYDNLSDHQKEQITDELKKKLEDDETVLLERTKEAAKEELKKKYDALVENGDYDEKGLEELKKIYEEAVADIDKATVPDTKEIPEEKGPWKAELLGADKLDGVKLIKVIYTNTEGAGSNWTKGSDIGDSFVFKRNVNDSKTFDAFVGVKVDGNELSESSYTAKAGSVIITLKPSYLDTLSVGEHTLTALFSDGDDVIVKFNILAKTTTSEEKQTKVTSPDKGKTLNADKGKSLSTGDGINLFLCFMFMCVSIIGILGMIIIRKKYNHTEE